MKPHELRIGNWVKVDDLPEEQVNLLFFKTMCEAPGSIPFIRPIALSEEWLKKLGATEWPGGDKGWNLKNHLIEFADCRNVYIHKATRVELKYVHQLQNLYFALTGEELTIQ